jgi:hypothetical protein
MKTKRKKAASKIRWTAHLKKLPALSVRQPWAWLIVNGYKDVENRSWRTRHRGPLLIHAGASTSELYESIIAKIERRHGIKMPKEYYLGGIVGVVDVEDCKARTGSPWHFRGAIGWVLSNPRRLPYRQVKGALGLFKPKFKTV